MSEAESILKRGLDALLLNFGFAAPCSCMLLPAMTSNQPSPSPRFEMLSHKRPPPPIGKSRLKVRDGLRDMLSNDQQLPPA
jgi:hypothetical protein